MAMSRRSPRIRARFAATVQVAGLPHTLVCHTRDISIDGCFLDTAEVIAVGVPVALALMDNERGEVVQVDGVVARCLPGGADGAGRGIGVKLDDATPEWLVMVSRYQRDRTGDTAGPPVRLAVLVVGDEQQRRGALALYVTSGWDVRFAIDQATAEEALDSADIDAVIAEFEADDPRARAVLEAARRLQPAARRVIRASLTAGGASDGLYHRAVAREAGLEVLLDALIEGRA